MKKCYLHIGNFKTGSTSLQSFLYINKNIFKKKNFQLIYEKNYFKKHINNQNLYKYFDKKNLKKIKNYFSGVKKNSNIIISSEFFSCFSYNISQIDYIKKTILKLGFKPIIIFYYRSDNSYLYSLYAQQMTQRKSIEIDSIFNFTKKLKNFGYYFNKKNNRYFMSQNYNLDNRKIVKNWKKVFKNDFLFSKFDKYVSENIFSDFLKNLELKDISAFKFSEKKNVTRKLKFWNLKRIFYYLYLSFMQSKIFTKKQLNPN